MEEILEKIGNAAILAAVLGAVVIFLVPAWAEKAGLYEVVPAAFCAALTAQGIRKMKQVT
jgi:hypothetical protein